MASNKKKRSVKNNEGPVKIVGLHHNVCLGSELYSEGWIREQFADVLFYCQPSKNNSSSTLKRNLRANRSVLAASSKFFASLLPEGELENEICISTELLYSDLFCILEYIYSGKLLCSLQKKDEILSLLREYKVFVPDNLTTAAASVEESELIDLEAPPLVNTSVHATKMDHKKSNDRQTINKVSSTTRTDLDHNYFMPQFSQNVPSDSSDKTSTDLNSPARKGLIDTRVTYQMKQTTDDDVPQYLANQWIDQDSTCATNDSNIRVKAEADIDLALSNHFLQREKMKKKRLQFKIRKYSRSLEKHIEIANKILKTQATKEKGMDEMHVDNKAIMQHTKKAKPKVQCEKCRKSVLADRLKFHLMLHSGVKSHLCERCGRSFTLKCYLAQHIRINHSQIERAKRFICAYCGYAAVSKDKLEIHERTHTGERPFECKYCDKRFKEKGTLVRHIRTHTGERPYVCQVCNAAFTARSTCVEHYKTQHANKKPPSESRRQYTFKETTLFRCDFCDQSFRRLLAYEKHRATHTGISAAVRCSRDGCDFNYSDMAQLREHMIKDHPNLTYPCDHCSKVFLTRKNLNDHQSKHDSSLGFRCSLCPLSLTTKFSLIAHEKLHARETPHECTYCDERFHSPYLLKIHLRKHAPRQPTKRKRKINRMFE